MLRDTCNRYFSCQIVRGSHTDPGKLQSESIRINRRDLSCRVGACRLPGRLLPPMRPSSVDTQSTIAFSVSVAPPGRHRLACYSYVSPVVLPVTAVSFDVFEPPGPGREERPNAQSLAPTQLCASWASRQVPDGRCRRQRYLVRRTSSRVPWYIRSGVPQIDLSPL